MKPLKVHVKVWSHYFHSNGNLTAELEGVPFTVYLMTRSYLDVPCFYSQAELKAYEQIGHREANLKPGIASSLK